MRKLIASRAPNRGEEVASVDNKLSITAVSETGKYPRNYMVRSLWNAGWSGRDQRSVQQHIEELAEIGVPAPTTTPIYFPLSNNLATTANRIQVLGAESSGEIEYAMLFDDQGEVFVTVASDHTDRPFERYGIQPSKQLCPKVLAPEVWLYGEVRRHWENLVLRCWVTKQGDRMLYQEAGTAELLGPEHWFDALGGANIVQPGLVFLSGTPATVGGWVFGETYELELEDPIQGRVIRHRYEVEVLGPGYQ